VSLSFDGREKHIFPDRSVSIDQSLIARYYYHTCPTRRISSATVCATTLISQSSGPSTMRRTRGSVPLGLRSTQRGPRRRRSFERLVCAVRRLTSCASRHSARPARLPRCSVIRPAALEGQLHLGVMVALVLKHVLEQEDRSSE
jgi:hypothetical protein